MKKTEVITRGKGLRVINTDPLEDRPAPSHGPKTLSSPIFEQLKIKGIAPVNLAPEDVSISESQEVPRFRPIFGVANHFTEFVHSVAPVDLMETPEFLIAAASLTREQLVGLFNDSYGDVAELNALLEAVPKLQAFFIRRPPSSDAQKRSWAKVAQDGFEKLRAEGMTREQIADHIGMSMHDFTALENGEFAPSLEEFRNIATLPGFEKTHLSIGIPYFSTVLVKFLKSRNWRYSVLASQTRIPVNRIHELLRGAQPNQSEVKRLRIMIPDLPSWREKEKDDPSSSLVDLVSPPSSTEKEEMLSIPEAVRTIEEGIEDTSIPEARKQVAETLADPERLQEILDIAPGQEENVIRVLQEFSEPRSVDNHDHLLEEKPKSVPPPVPSQPVPLASDYPTLTEEEKARVVMFEDALLRLCGPDPLKRQELFPDDISTSGGRWQLEFIKKLLHAHVITKIGAAFNTKYSGDKERVESLLGDPEWLLKLTFPIALHRVVPSDLLEEGSDSMTETDPLEGGLSDADILRVLPQYYEVLTYQHERITAIEQALNKTNAKLDAILAHLGVPPVKEDDDNSR